MSKHIVNATDENFKNIVLESDVPVLVDFWAPWCGPCRMIAPIIEEIADEYAGRLKVVKLNTDENMDSALEYSIRSIPTLGIFRDGQIVDTVIGAAPKKMLKAKIDQHLFQVTVN